MVVTDLLNTNRRGDAVNARIYAINDIGQAEAGEGNGAYLPTIPDAPVAIELFARGDSELTIRWTNGESDGHNAISEYTIRVEEEGQSSTRSTALLDSSVDRDAFAQHMFTAENLDNGVIYTFSVAAKNIAGKSDFFSESFVVGTAPAKPTNIETERSDNAQQVVITWTSARSVGVLDVTATTVYVLNHADSFDDVTDLCIEGSRVHSQERCTLSMDLLGEAPFSLE